AADGYLRGEGCGVVTLRRLADAERDGDKILGIIRSSAIGHNGAGSGLTVPNPKAQEDVIRKALDRAGLEPTDVDYLEAHGTGTSLGDPIEVNAAAAAYCGQRQSDDPLLIGSVKTNIGHLEAAAGMAGLIKVLLSLQNGSIPGQMNFETPNPHIAWDKTPVKVLTEETAWPRKDRRLAGVSAFGMSGTNAHVILEAPESSLNGADGKAAVKAPVVEKPSTDSTSQSNPVSMITLSGKSDDALFDLADAWASALGNNADLDLASVVSQSNLHRSHFEHRAAIVATNPKEAVKSLQSIARGSTSDQCFIGNHRRKPRVAWQFTGQGCQYVGMGRQLYDTQPVYRRVIDDCDQQLRELRSGSLLEVLFENTSDDPQINNTHWTQPAIFALQQGLVKLLQSWGIHPDLVMGHSVGQYAAACVAGIMTWENGLRLIAERGRLIGELPADGLMLAVFAPVEAIQSLVDSQSGVSLAALNGTHIVVSGETEGVIAIESSLETRGVKTKRLTTSHAFHSQLMDPVLQPFAAIANEIDFQPAQMPLICNVSGEVIGADQQLDGQYWANHIRSAVAYSPSLETLSEKGCDVLLEIGPNAVLTRMAAAKWKGAAGTLIGTLQKKSDDIESISKSMAQAYVQGVTPDFQKLHSTGETASREANQQVALPTYPFQRRRFWGPDKPRAAHAEYHTAHPLLGSKIQLAGIGDEVRYESFIDTDSPAWLPDHSVMDLVVLPGAALIEMAIEAAGDRAVENIRFEQPIRPNGRTALQTVVRKSKDDPNMQLMEVFARVANGQNWVRHFSCELVAVDSSRPATVDLEAALASTPESESPESFYEKMSELGLNYGPAFQCIQKLNLSTDGVVAQLQLAGDVRGFNVPPTMLDAALHSLAVGLLRSGDDHLFLPVGIGRVDFYAPIETEAVCVAKWIENEGKNRSADLTILSKSGEVLIAIKELKVQQVSLSALRQMSGSGAQRLVYDLIWKPARLPAADLAPKRWLIVNAGEGDEFAAKVRQRLIDQNHQVEEMSPQQLLESFADPTNENQTEQLNPEGFGFDGL
ncbi:type I polyketide synthase, partial [Mariniblastus sp.]|nr:type I polyketide synthase [Mariniblastus sp.]